MVLGLVLVMLQSSLRVCDEVNSQVSIRVKVNLVEITQYVVRCDIPRVQTMAKEKSS